jgi:uncharacterized protein
MQRVAKVVLDTNVVISAFISRDGSPARVFELLLEGKIINFTTKEILSEVQDVLGREKIKACLAVGTGDFVLCNLREKSLLVFPDRKIEAVRQDQADNRFLECAAAAKADFIISGDKHLLQLKRFGSTQIVSPKEFLVLNK